jgi:hypothetical protein
LLALRRSWLAGESRQRNAGEKGKRAAHPFRPFSSLWLLHVLSLS